MAKSIQVPSLADIAFFFAPAWGPLSFVPLFYFFPSLLERLGTFVFYVGLVVFPALGVRGILRTSSGGPVLNFFVGCVYFFPAMLFCGAVFWGACGMLGACKT